MMTVRRSRTESSSTWNLELVKKVSVKLKIELGKNESIEDAEEFLAKAAKAKQDCSGEERYADGWLNDLESYACQEHQKVLDQIASEIAAEVELHAGD